ncbi:hypothetical protein vBKpnAMK4_00412 [Klebsiella phage vB_Kpn_AM_K4]
MLDKDYIKEIQIIGNFLLPEGKDPGDLDAEEVDQLIRNVEILIAEHVKI